MKTYWKIGSVAVVSALVLGIGSTFVAGQSTTPTSTITTITPTGTVSAPPASTSGRGLPPARAGEPGRQPHMDAAWLRLDEARRQLDLADHDKGGYREKAIASIAQAIKDVEDGIEYAHTHTDEFPGRGRGAAAPRGTVPGPRGTAGTARGPRGTSTTATTAAPTT